MKRGDVFYHCKRLAEDLTPIRCVVTAVRQGWVYWKQEGERKAKLCFRVEQADKYVMPNAGTEALGNRVASDALLGQKLEDGQ